MDEKYLKLLEQFKKENFKKKIRHKNETEKLYHVDVYMPQQLIESSRNLLYGDMRISKHLINHLNFNSSKNRYAYTNNDILHVIERLKLEKKLIPFEVATIDGKTAEKACFRIQLGDNDMSIVVRKNVIVTAWINKQEDSHFTLDRTKYCKQ